MSHMECRAGAQLGKSDGIDLGEEVAAAQRDEIIVDSDFELCGEGFVVFINAGKPLPGGVWRGRHPEPCAWR